MDTVFDVIIVGGGPAGASAALTLRSRNKKTALFTARQGALEKAHAINNYPGLCGMGGKEMNDLFLSEVQKAGVQVFLKKVSQIMSFGGQFSVLAGDDIFTCSALILCPGAGRVKELPGEKDGLGRGVSYCATCDGMLYRGKDVVVVSGWDEAAEEAAFLASICRKVYYIEERKDAPDPSALPALKKENITVLDDAPRAVEYGENGYVSGLRGDKGFYPAEAVFFLRPSAPPDSLLPGLATADGRITADENGRTNLEKVYAAGDACMAVKQVSVAVGSGCLAALAAAKDLGS